MKWLEKYQFGGSILPKYTNPYFDNLPQALGAIQSYIGDASKNAAFKTLGVANSALKWFAQSKLEKEQQENAQEIAMRNLNDNYQNNMYSAFYNQGMSFMQDGGEIETPEPDIFAITGEQNPFDNWANYDQEIPAEETFVEDGSAPINMSNYSDNVMAGTNAEMKYLPLVKSSASKYGVPAALLMGLIKAESNFNPAANSGEAQGIAQFTPETAKDYGVNVNDPASSIDGAARYLQNLYKQFGDWDKSVMAYNAGPGNVINGKAYGFKETTTYLSRVKQNAAMYSNLENPKIKTKPGVNISNTDPRLTRFLNDASALYPGLKISSGNDSKHMKGSKHYKNKAIDIGANSSNKDEYNAFKNLLLSDPAIKQSYGIEDIIDEGDHLHIELMRKGGIIDPRGQWSHPGKETIVPTPTGDITMQGVNYPVAAFDNKTGEFMTVMEPNREYKFNTNQVLEVPIMRKGGWLKKY